MITIEKVASLKAIPLFQFTKDEALFKIATIVEEKFIKKDEIVIQKGDLSNTLFMVVKGLVSIVNEEREIRTIGPNEVVGELSALIPGKRIATVIAKEDTLFFTISHTDLYVLMEKNFELVKGIIKFLCEQLRHCESALNR